MPGPSPHNSGQDTGTPALTPGCPNNGNRHHGDSEGSRTPSGDPISSRRTGSGTARDQVHAHKAQLQRMLVIRAPGQGNDSGVSQSGFATKPKAAAKRKTKQRTGSPIRAFA
eukprot:174562-Heterocapsa_arctica.AAC.1